MWTDELTEAVKEFQKALGVDQTGEIDAATVAAFHEAIEEFKASLEEPDPEPSETPEPSQTPSPTASA